MAEGQERVKGVLAVQGVVEGVSAEAAPRAPQAVDVLHAGLAHPVERRDMLADLVSGGERIHFSQTYEGSGPAVFAKIDELERSSVEVP